LNTERMPIHLPNLLTILRFCLVPIVIDMIISREWALAFALFVLAGLTDAIDGAIARQFHLRTELGAYLDPLADKALLVSIYVTLGIVGLIPAWLAILVVARDIMIIGAILLAWVMHNPVPISPLRVSKANTFMQIAFAAYMLGTLAFGVMQADLARILMLLVAALTVLSTAAYLSVWLRHMTR